MRQAKLMNCALVMGADGSSPFGNWVGYELSATVRFAVSNTVQRAWHTDDDVVAVSFNQDVFAHADCLYTSNMTKVFPVASSSGHNVASDNPPQLARLLVGRHQCEGEKLCSCDWALLLILKIVEPRYEL